MAEETKQITVSIIGPGSRGLDTYGNYLLNCPDMKIVAVLGNRKRRVDYALQKLNLPDTCGYTDEDEFFKEKRSDVAIITSPDSCHYRHLRKCLILGYDILMEKPVCNNYAEYEKLLQLRKQHNNKVMVGYVLRYLPAIQQVMEYLKNGEIGELQGISHMEQVNVKDFIHSYVRGRWADQNTSSNTLLAKCSHDLDLIHSFICASLGKDTSQHMSYGVKIDEKDLTFALRNAPANTSSYCLDCEHCFTCPYNAYDFYYRGWKEKGKPEDQYPYNTICEAPVTADKIMEAIQTSDYGRCVYSCDNNAPDFVSVNITCYNNGYPQILSNLIMNGLSARGGRIIKLYGNKGEIDYDEEQGNIYVKYLTGETKKIQINTYNTKGGYSHSLADECMMDAFIKYIRGDESANLTSLEGSYQSHLFVFES